LPVMETVTQRSFLICGALAVFLPGGALADRLPLQHFSTIDGLPNNSVHRIVRDSRGFVWFCTSEGLARYGGYKFFNYGTDEGLPHRDVADLPETRTGSYWVATADGLCQFLISTDEKAVSQPVHSKFVTFRAAEHPMSRW